MTKAFATSLMLTRHEQIETSQRGNKSEQSGKSKTSEGQWMSEKPTSFLVVLLSFRFSTFLRNTFLITFTLTFFDLYLIELCFSIFS